MTPEVRMRKIILFAALLAPACSSREPEKEVEDVAFDERWEYVLPEGQKKVNKGGQAVWYFKEGNLHYQRDKTPGVYSLTVTKRGDPGHLDLVEESSKRKRLCIYRREGDVLLIALGGEGDIRPRDFSGERLEFRLEGGK